MEHLISKYGPPQSTLTDNGLVFTARLAGRKAGRNGFEKLLQAHHIRQKNGRPGHPQTQGKIERFHQTLKRWLKTKPRPTTIQELQQLLDQFHHWYNHQRPHRAIGRKTPNQAYQHLPKATPQPHNKKENKKVLSETPFCQRCPDSGQKWRCGESNPGPVMQIQEFSGCSLLIVFLSFHTHANKV